MNVTLPREEIFWSSFASSFGGTLNWSLDLLVEPEINVKLISMDKHDADSI